MRMQHKKSWKPECDMKAITFVNEHVLISQLIDCRKVQLFYYNKFY